MTSAGSGCRLAYLIGQLEPGGQERQLYTLLENLDRQQFLPAVIVWNYNPQDHWTVRLAGLDIPVGGGTTAVEAPLLYPYYPKQLLGLMGGLQGAAEYEAALVTKYPKYLETSAVAVKSMGPQTVAHLVIICFVIMGNIAFFLQHRQDKLGREK